MHAHLRLRGARFAALALSVVLAIGAVAPSLATAQQTQPDTMGVKQSQEPLFTARDALYATMSALNAAASNRAASSLPPMSGTANGPTSP